MDRKVPLKLLFLGLWQYLLILEIGAQPPSPHWQLVLFADRGSEKTTIRSGETALGDRALDRRRRQGIRLDSLDLPVHPAYLKKLSQGGFRCGPASRWLNGIVVYAHPTDRDSLLKLSFVDTVLYLGKRKAAPGGNSRPTDRQPADPPTEKQNPFLPFLQFLGIDTLHARGFRGEGVSIALLDAGFSGARASPYLGDRLTGPHRNLLLGHGGPVFQRSGHGTAVLGILAADQAGGLTGAAPAADFTCLVTEDPRGEQRLEDYLWMVGMEYADSIGADLVVSSLGYRRFGKGQRSYGWEDLDGRTAFSSRAATIAGGKGILVVVSVGNARLRKNRGIRAPADGAGILAVGSGDLSGKISSFSTFGLTPDGRQKPELIAPGESVPILRRDGRSLGLGRGTSFSAPWVAGLAACLMEAFPRADVRLIRKALLVSASPIQKRRERGGFGIPRAMEAYRWLAERVPPGQP